MSGVIVEQEMRIKVCWRFAVNLFQKQEKLLIPMSIFATSDDATVKYVKGGKQSSGFVTLTVVGHTCTPVFIHGQTFLGSI